MAHRQKSGLPSTTRVERKVIEKNRRNHMKNLCYKLNSLLPNFSPRQTLPRVEQIDEAINYIRNLETKVKMVKERKESLLLMGSKMRSHSSYSNALETQESLIKSPIIKIHEMDSLLEVVLICGFDNDFIYNEIIRLLHEENIVVCSANSSIVGDSVFYVVHAEIQNVFQFAATKVSERLKKFVNMHRQDFQAA